MNRRSGYVMLPLLVAVGLFDAGEANAKTITCGGVQVLRLANRTLSGVVATANCKLTLTNCLIRAKRVAVHASANASVTLRNCEISGQKMAIRARHNATVKVVRSKVHGALRRSENASIVRKRSRFFKRPAKGGGRKATSITANGTRVAVGPRGTRIDAPGVRVKTSAAGARVKAGSTRVATGKGGTRVQVKGARVRPGWTERGAGSAAKVVSARKPRAGLKASGALVCGGSKDMVVRNRLISAQDTAVVVKGACNLRLINCHVVGGRIGVRVVGSGDVFITNSYVQGAGAAVVVSGAGDVHATRSTFYGKIKKSGAGDFNNKGKNVIKRRWRP